ncbi:hypothetical protein PanWU01x14_232340 [Parasponia andersonii]|uniref:Uncharacterized protein n=1 Tax=Parasponia andersonii TaxID=3476 RepID=A0A2P5BK32_PARAD|nr:hypothetical protein PanWU01x14_232340 [Parasponia andersonii]
MAKTTYVNLKLGQMRSKPPKFRKWTALSWMISFVLVLSVVSFLGNLSSASLYLLTDPFAKPRCCWKVKQTLLFTQILLQEKILNFTLQAHSLTHSLEAMLLSLFSSLLEALLLT